MNSCRRIRKLLSLRLDEPLTERDEARVAQHLAECTSCARALRASERIREAAGTLREVPWAYSVAEEVVAAARDAGRRAPGRSWVRWAAAGLAVVGLVVVVLAVYPRFAERSRPVRPAAETFSLQVFEREHAIFSEKAAFADQAAWSVAATKLSKSPAPNGG